MFETLPDIRVELDGWYSVNQISGLLIGSYFKLRNKSNKPCYIVKSVTQPAADSKDGILLSDAYDYGLGLEIASGSAEVWVKGVGAILSVETTSDPSPDGLFYGYRAITIQDYEESNKKNATQFAASRIVENVNNSTVFASILKLGDKPIDLKSRQFAYTGIGLVADIFENPTYTITGSPDQVFSANGIIPSDFDFELYAGNAFTLTDNGTQFAPTIYCIGPVSQQSKGVPTGLYGSNYILAPNTSYLLTFQSRDTQAQSIAVRIEGYNGFMDIPL